MSIPPPTNPAPIPSSDTKLSNTELYLNRLRQQSIPLQSYFPSAVQSTKDSFVRDLTLLNKTVNHPASSNTKNQPF